MLQARLLRGSGPHEDEDEDVRDAAAGRGSAAEPPSSAHGALLKMHRFLMYLTKELRFPIFFWKMLRSCNFQRLCSSKTLSHNFLIIPGRSRDALAVICVVMAPRRRLTPTNEVARDAGDQSGRGPSWGEPTFNSQAGDSASWAVFSP